MRHSRPRLCWIRCTAEGGFATHQGTTADPLELLAVDRLAIGNVGQAVVNLGVDRVVHPLDGAVAEGHAEAVGMRAAERRSMHLVAGSVLQGLEGQIVGEVEGRTVARPADRVPVPAGIPALVVEVATCPSA